MALTTRVYRRRLILVILIGSIALFKIWPYTLHDTRQIIAQNFFQNNNYMLQNSKEQNKNYQTKDDFEQEDDIPEDQDDPDLLDNEFIFDDKYWFMKNGTKYPEEAQINPITKKRDSKLWPQEDVNDDRIVNQLMYIPNNYNSNNVKKILLFNALTSWNVKLGSKVFSNCPVSACSLTTNKVESPYVDMILYRDYFTHPGHNR